jgi:RNase H-like domain found in reverse transcriptase
LLVSVNGEAHVVYASLNPSAESQKECRTTFVSAVKAKQSVRKGEAWSMVHVNAVETGLSTTKKQDQKLNVDWQRLISKYQDVFAEEYPGMPPPRQVELKIELEEGTKPVSRPVYKLSLVEQDELKARLSCCWSKKKRTVGTRCPYIKKLQPAEENYPVHDLELMAIVYALHEWRVYLRWIAFEIESDHHPLRYLDFQPKLSKHQMR